MKCCCYLITDEYSYMGIGVSVGKLWENCLPLWVGACTLDFDAIFVIIGAFGDESTPPWFLYEENGGVSHVEE